MFALVSMVTTIHDLGKETLESASFRLIISRKLDAKLNVVALNQSVKFDFRWFKTGLSHNGGRFGGILYGTF